MRLSLSSKDKRKKSYGLLGEGTNCLKIYIRIKLAIRLLIYNTGKQKDIERLPRGKKGNSTILYPVKILLTCLGKRKISEDT